MVLTGDGLADVPGYIKQLHALVTLLVLYPDNFGGNSQDLVATYLLQKLVACSLYTA